MSNDPAFRRHTSFLLATLGRRTEARWGSFLRGRGVTNTEFSSLAVLAGESPSQRDLARQLGVDPRNAVAVVRRLVKRGWVISTPDAADRRRVILSLTSAGRDFWDALQADLGHLRTGYFDALSPAEQRELQRLLNKLNDAHLAGGERHDPGLL